MICPVCNKEFKKTGRNHKFCSSNCQRQNQRAGVNYCQECYSPLIFENKNKLKARKYCLKCSFKIKRKKENERRRKFAV